MLNEIFESVVTSSTATSTVSIGSFLACLVVSIILGALIGWGYMYKNRYTQSFVVTLALLPAMVQMVIMLVNGNLGTGVAVMGAFSLVRFRSLPGSAKEIGFIFWTMAIGLATGMGYIGIAILFTVILLAIHLLYIHIDFGDTKKAEKELKVTIPESLDYTDVFDDLFQEYTTNASLIRVKTTNMGSLFQLFYRVRLKEGKKEKEFIDKIRCRNGNLDIICSRVNYGNEEL